MKICCTCKIEKDNNDFGKDISRDDNKSPICKECSRERRRKYRTEHPDKVKASNKQYRRKYPERNKIRRITWGNKNKDKVRRQQYTAKYKITEKQYEDTLMIQDNKCSICKEKFTKTPNVDHCHVDGTFRGLLCNKCNSGLGFFKESIEALQEAILYLSRFKH